MRLPLSWLREWCDLPLAVPEIAERLTMAGIEVEQIIPIGEGLQEVIVAEVREVSPHPAAERLRACVVFDGERDRSIVCGAGNVRPGLRAPLALPGAVLPDGRRIETTALRGVRSEGMLCSAAELGLGEERGALLELDPATPAGIPLAQALGLPDHLLELKLTPNRGDCLSVRGLARELATLFGQAMQGPAIEAVEARSDRRLAVSLERGAGCARYLGRIIEGLDPRAVTPGWMRERLRRAGLRPLHVVVDVTNYVMLELGQPLHAFALAALSGGIEVRRARSGERLVLLDGREVRLDPEFLVIADGRGPVALAGIMGGEESRVREDTNAVFIESAFFAPQAVMGRARRLGLATDAAHRFERGVDPELPRVAMERASALLLALAGGRPGPIVEAVLPEELPKREPILLRRERLARVLGLVIPDAEVERILGALGLALRPHGEGWWATPPSARFDLEREEDLIEELIRIHGYERLPAMPLAGVTPPARRPEGQIAPERLREWLAARGYSEAICFAFVGDALLAQWGMDEAVVRLANPLSAELAVMRPSLIPGLAEAARFNRYRQRERIRLFELGRSFHPQAEGAPREIERLALLLCGPRHAGHWCEPGGEHDFYDLKGDLESLLALLGRPSSFEAAAKPWLHPGRSAVIKVQGIECGWMGQLDPKLAARLDLPEATLACEIELGVFAERPLPRAVMPPRFPSVRRDLAFELEERIPFAEVERIVREAVGSPLVDLLLFDEYRGGGLGEGRRSLAIGLILQDSSRTLTDDEVDGLVARVVAAMQQKASARLRA